MKDILSLSAFLMGINSCLGSTDFDTVFANRFSDAPSAPFYDAGGALLSGDSFLAQLYAGAERNALRAVGTPVRFRSGTDAGFVSRTVVPTVIDGDGTSQIGFFQVRAWPSSGGSTFESAVRSGLWTGVSDVLATRVFDRDWCDIPCGPAYLEGLRYPGPPLIVDQPAVQSLEPGGSAQVGIVASGSIALFYQWYEGQSGDTHHAVTNATESIFTTLPLFETTRFWCRLTTAVGSTDSKVAEIAVVPRTGPLLVMNLAERQPRLWIVGPTNVPLRMEYSGGLSAPNWELLTKITLPVSPLPYLDASAPIGEQRFYRILPP